MTNQEYFNHLLPEIPQEIKTAIMTARGVDPLAVFTSGIAAVELAEADIYMRILILPDFTEGSLSLKYDRAHLVKLANQIYGKHNDEKYNDGQPLIRRVQL